MTPSDEARQILLTIARTAEEHGNALNRTFQIFGDGALLGPIAGRLHGELAERHAIVRQAFLTAFDAVELIATADGKPSETDRPSLRPPPAALPPPPGGYVGGSPALMETLEAEFGRVGRGWQDAGEQLSRALSRLGLPATAGQTVTQAGSWLVDRRGDLARRRAELLKTPSPPVMEGQSRVTGTAGPTTGSTLDTLLDLRERIRAPVETFFEGATSVVNAGIAWTSDFWADQVEGLSVKIGVPELGRTARRYADHVARPLAQGVNEGGWALVEGAWNWSPLGIISDPLGFVNRMRGAYRAGTFAVEEPVEFVKAVADLETLQRDPARWFGRLVPDILVTAATAGAGGGIAGALRLRKGVDNATPPRSHPGSPYTSPFRDPNITRHAGNATQQEFDALFKDLKGVNPQFSTKAWGYTNNCQSCVVVVDRILGGSPPIAAVPQHPNHMFNWPRSVTDAVGGGRAFRRVTGYDQIVKELLAAGDGARGIVHGRRIDPSTGKPVPGHVFNVVNRNGKIYFIDGQTNGWAKPEQYSSMEFLRTN